MNLTELDGHQIAVLIFVLLMIGSPVVVVLAYAL